MLADELIEDVAVGNHANEACLVTQRDDGVPSNREILLAGLRVRRQQRVDEPKQLHDALILPDIFVAFEQEYVLAAIVSREVHFSRMLLAREDRKDLAEFGNPGDSMATSEGAWDGDLQIL